MQKLRVITFCYSTPKLGDEVFPIASRDVLQNRLNFKNLFLVGRPQESGQLGRSRRAVGRTWDHDGFGNVSGCSLRTRIIWGKYKVYSVCKCDRHLF